MIEGIEYEWAEGDRGLCLKKAIQVGATKTQNGKTYVFNENKRWALKREPKAEKPPKQVKPKAAKAKKVKPEAMPNDLAQMRAEVLQQPLTPRQPDQVKPKKAKATVKPKTPKAKAMPEDLVQMRSEVLAQPLTPRQPDQPKPQLKPKSTIAKPRKGDRRSLQPKTPTPQATPAPIVQQVESHPEIQVAAKRVGAISRAVESVKSMGDSNPAIAKLKATAQANPGAVEDIAVAAIAMAGQFALMPQADLATAALMQGAIGVATRAGARTGKRVREELKQDPNTLKSLQGVIKLGKGILSDLMSQETQEKMIGDAIGPAMAAGTGAAVGGGLAGAVAGTGAAVGGAPRAAAAIRQVAAQKLRPKATPKQLKPVAPRQLKPKAA